jgi:hypothetical protein
MKFTEWYKLQDVIQYNAFLHCNYSPNLSKNYVSIYKEKCL